METRASYVVIGTFTVAVIFAAFLFALWFAQYEIDSEFAQYDIVFDSPVTGLSKAGEVRYSGIKVGEVKDLRLDPDNPGRVLARIEVDSATPMTEDTAATLEFWGLTGVSYIQLTGGTASSVPLEAPPGRDVPFIIATPSALQEVFAGAPNVLAGASELLVNLQDVLNEENRARISNTLANIETATASLADRSEEIGALVDNVSAASQDLAAFARTTNRLVEDDGAELIRNARDAADNVNQLAVTANAMLDENRAAIRTFSEEGLQELGTLVTESRQLLQSLDRVVGRLESDPARYLSGNDLPDYQGD